MFWKIIGSSTIALAIASGAQAQTPAGDNGSPAAQTSVQDIIVTARRVSERLQDVPVAITAVQGSELQSLGVERTSDLGQVVAGLSLTPAAGRTSSPIYAIRGQRAGDISLMQDAPVALYLDEVLITPLQGGNLGLFDLENVQVLKGPQGTLFGRNTTGGAVLFTTAKPDKDFGGYVRLGYGNYDEKRAQGVINLPVSDRFRLRAAVDYTNRDGFGKVVMGAGKGNPLADRDEFNARLTAAIDPTDWLSTVTTAYYSRSRNSNPNFVVIGDPNPVGPAVTIFKQAFLDAIARQRSRDVYDGESNILSRTGVTVRGINNTISAELSDNLTLKNIFGYRKVHYFDNADNDGTILPILESHNITRVRTFSEELQLQGTGLDDRLNFVTGGYYFDQKGIDTSNGTVTFGVPSSTGGPIHNSSFSAFFQGGYKLGDATNLTAGVRYTVDRRAYDITSGNGFLNALTTCNLLDPTGARLPVSACVIKARATFSRPTWLVSLDHKLDPETMVYIATRRGYRAGGFNLRATSNSDVGPFAPETVTDIELGLKRGWELGGDWHLTTNLAVYHQWYKDIQRNVTALIDNQLRNVIQNAASAKVDGGEAELELRAGRLFKLGVNYAYVKPKYKSFPLLAPIDGVIQATSYANRTFGWIPRHQLNVSATLSPDLGSIGNFNLTANVAYQSRIVFSEQYQSRAQLVEALAPAAKALVPTNLRFGQNGYAIVNLRAELNDIGGSPVSAALWARNIFDKRYIASPPIFYASLGFNYGTYSDPATYGAEVTVRF